MGILYDNDDKSKVESSRERTSKYQLMGVNSRTLWVQKPGTKQKIIVN